MLPVARLLVGILLLVTGAVSRGEQGNPPAVPDRRAPLPAAGFRDALPSGAGPELVVIPAGSFAMGDPDVGANGSTAPVHAVTIARPFAIGRTEVTFSEYDRFAAATGRVQPDDAGGGRGSHPIMNVDWHDAAAYAEWLSAQSGRHYRLPSEAEWEYAAAAGSVSEYSFGDDAGLLCGNGNVGDRSAAARYAYFTWTVDCNDGYADSAPTGSFPPNGFGLYDVHGNVAEWTADCWNDDYLDAPADGSPWIVAECGSRVVRGGSWFDGPAEQRLRVRYGNDSAMKQSDLGFRIARDLDADEFPGTQRGPATSR